MPCASGLGAQVTRLNFLILPHGQKCIGLQRRIKTEGIQRI
jgi:hypothetical protein